MVQEHRAKEMTAAMVLLLKQPEVPVVVLALLVQTELVAQVEMAALA